ncbi:hypothetical protein KP014_08540 [Paenibacillus sophorae]|uniref:Uncharacterized protein n=1 Tax=Paenibacillus sophorae TaxID=1333845 RepID=A0ABX8HHL0_9BACL|nr:hypothetical protein [Paenibacillus sophorae]QWU17196.1 hypothetical protein KP014_08540 [Paenibacillus sophorae]
MVPRRHSLSSLDETAGFFCLQERQYNALNGSSRRKDGTAESCGLVRRSGHPPLNLARERKRRKTAACSRAEFGTGERPIRYIQAARQAAGYAAYGSSPLPDIPCRAPPEMERASGKMSWTLPREMKISARARQEEWYRGGETRRLFEGDGGFLHSPIDEDNTLNFKSGGIYNDSAAE